MFFLGELLHGTPSRHGVSRHTSSFSAAVVKDDFRNVHDVFRTGDAVASECSTFWCAIWREGATFYLPRAFRSSYGAARVDVQRSPDMLKRGKVGGGVEEGFVRAGNVILVVILLPASIRRGICAEQEYRSIPLELWQRDTATLYFCALVHQG